jgi:hypothetical protein
MIKRAMATLLLVLLAACGGAFATSSPDTSAVSTYEAGYEATRDTVYYLTMGAFNADRQETQEAEYREAFDATIDAQGRVPRGTPSVMSTVTITNVKGAILGNMASVSIHGPPNTQCTIMYFTPAGTDSTAQGLIPKTTDASGNATWSWTIGTFTRPGTGHVVVMCGDAKAIAPIRVG